MRTYAYVGPSEIRDAVADRPRGALVRSTAELERALAELGLEAGAMCTFVVDDEGHLRLADRRSEHVACAGGAEVLAAGEMSFERDRRGWRLSEVTNQSTGYCPEASTWAAVGRSLEAIGVRHPGSFTHELTFRRCTSCGGNNLVKDEHFVCDLCGAELPLAWNFDAPKE
jgi:hypothetical protein